MAEDQGVDTPTAKGVGMTLIGVAALMGVAYVCDRIYLRWLHENHPLAEHRARMRRMSTGYQRQRTNLKDVYDIVTDVLVEVARATGDAR
jgi:uncharacterized protein YneF (UPF0154 family)